MSEKGKHQNLTIHTKEEILWKHLYQKIKVNDLAAEYDVPANTVSTWKKHTDKYLKEAGQMSSKGKRNITSPYKDIKASSVILAKRDEI